MKTEIKILAIETASEACSAALLMSDGHQATKHTYKQIEPTPRQHAKKILSMLDMVLDEGNLALKDVDAIAFGRGPGAFTGLRIAAGVAQGVALSVDKPVVPVSTLAALAFEVDDKFTIGHENQIIATALDARMGEVYWGVFKRCDDGLELLGEEQVTTPENMYCSLLSAMNNLKDCHVLAVGAGWDVYQAELFNSTSRVKPDNLDYLENVIPTACAIAELGLSLFKNGQTVSAEDAQPVYIRNDVAKKSQKQGHI